MYKSVNRILSTKTKNKYRLQKKLVKSIKKKKTKIEYVVVKDVVILL